jgi:hypothetical protein
MSQRWEEDVVLGAEAMVAPAEGLLARDHFEAGPWPTAPRRFDASELEPLDEVRDERDHDLRDLIQHIFRLHRD